MRIGINGFGRIGRNFAKAVIERHPEIEIAEAQQKLNAANAALAPFGDVDPVDWSIEAVRALMAEPA